MDDDMICVRFGFCFVYDLLFFILYIFGPLFAREIIRGGKCQRWEEVVVKENCMITLLGSSVFMINEQSLDLVLQPAV